MLQQYYTQSLLPPPAPGVYLLAIKVLCMTMGVEFIRINLEHDDD